MQGEGELRGNETPTVLRTPTTLSARVHVPQIRRFRLYMRILNFLVVFGGGTNHKSQRGIVGGGEGKQSKRELRGVQHEVKSDPSPVSPKGENRCAPQIKH